MAKNDNLLLVIDIGGNNLRMGEFELAPGKAPVLTKFAFRRMDELIFDPDFAKGFAEVYAEMLETNGFTATNVRLTLSAQNSFQRLSKLPMANSSNLDKIIEFEARQTMPYAIEEVEWNYQLLRHEWVEHHKETNENGETDEYDEPHEDLEALFVAIKADQIAQYTDVIIDSGKKILSVDIAPIALFNAAKLIQIQEDECVLMLNIGCRSTSLMISDGDRAFIRNIPIAGFAITSQISKEFNVPLDEAEEMKRRYGFVALGGAFEEPESEMTATISKIARNVMTRLHGEISRSINVWRAQHGGHAPTKVLLSGGGSTMLYLPEFIQEKLRLPTEFLNTFSAITIGDGVNKETLQAVASMTQEMIGMVLRESCQCPIDISLLPRVVRIQRDLERRKPYFYVSAVALLLCFSVLAIGVNRVLHFEEKLVGKVGDQVDQVNAKLTEINELDEKKNAAQASYDEAVGILKSRQQWSAVLSELQSLLPDAMWLTKLEPMSGESSEDGEEPKKSSGVGLFGGVSSGDGTDQSKIPLMTRLSVAEISKLQEFNQLCLEGYTLVFHNHKQLEEELRSRLKDSKYFSEESKISEYDTAKNLTKFKLILNLKEAIKK